MVMVSEILVLVLLPAALIAAAGWDLASYTIPNLIPVSLLAGFAGFALAGGLPLGALDSHFMAGALGLVIGFGLFAAGVAGGGDAKLFAAACLWFGFPDSLRYALAASLFGGGLTLAILMFRKLPVPLFLLKQGWILRLHDRQAGIPYGVALSAGAFAILPYTDVFRAGLQG
jgi:prepilin peptidase CpaA